jgi:two-component sensor histidine kinase
VDFDAASMPLDRAVPIGLIVNELVTNSLKYAFDEDGGIIRIVFRLNQLIGQAELSVSDSGRGMGPTRPGSFGLRLVESLSRQLGGHLSVGDVPKGTMTSVTFPYTV